MNSKLLTLDFISLSILDGLLPVLMDGEKVVVVPRDSLDLWRRVTGKDLPIFANEVNSHTLAEWEFTFQLGEEIPIEKLRRAHMSKPTSAYRNERNTWGGSVTPCAVICQKCEATYPTWGKFCLGEKQRCDACGYVYEFFDW